jgi:hypothetical protein
MSGRTFIRSQSVACRRQSALGTLARLVGFACVLGMASNARAIVSSEAGPNIFDGVNINQLIGAETFYAQNYWGSRAVIANVEAGLSWGGSGGHETLQQVNTFISDPSITPQYDWHATMVGQVIAGNSPIGFGYGWIFDFGSGPINLSSWYGIAPSANLWSAAIATGWNADPSGEYSGSFNISTQSLVYAYQTAMQTGVNGRRADVINSSWGFDDPAGTAQETMIIDALAYANHTTVVMAAGNHDSGTAAVVGPASGYNGIAVGALSSDTSSPPYSRVATFSNTSPNDFYNPVKDTTKVGVRSAVDIVAPGDNLTLAYYGGISGGHTSGTDPSGGLPYYYALDMAGTSFAAPIVAGAAGLLVDVGYDRYGGGNSIDGRVIKAVLMNSADKTPGWNNAQVLSHSVITTTQGLDLNTGAGALNLTHAFSQYTAGTTDVPGLGGGTVQAIGWDYGQVSRGTPNDYIIDHILHAGDTMTATLSWFVNRSFDPITQTASDVQFSDLDLQVWHVLNGLPDRLIAQSISSYNTSEHLYFPLPGDGDYMIRVLWAGENYDLAGNTPDSEFYGLAWSAPEPGTWLLLCVTGGSLAACWLVRRRRSPLAT